MSEKKSELIKKIAKVGITAGLSLLPVVSNSQSIAKPVEKINWTKQQKTPYEKYILLINSKNSLLELSKYVSGVPKNYLSNGGNLNLYDYHYAVPQDQIQGYVADYLRKIGVCPECPECKVQKKRVSTKKVTTKKTSIKYVLPQKPAAIPTKKGLEEKLGESDTTKEKKEAGITYNIIEENITNNTTNNYYLSSDTISKKAKEDYLRFRTLIEGSKALNSPFGGITVNPQIGKGSLWVGPYVTFGFGSEKNSTETLVYQKILLSQTAQIFTETEGTRNSKSTENYPIGFGGTLSLNTKDNMIRFDLSYGLINEINSTSDVSESGFDRKLQGDKVIEEKPYNFVLDKGKTCKQYVRRQGIDIAVQPFNKVPIYLAAEAEHIGDMKKINCKKGNVNFNVKLGGNFGWRKK